MCTLHFLYLRILPHNSFTILSQLALQDDYFFAIKLFLQLSVRFSVFCDIEIWSSFASVYEPILGSFY